MSRRTRGSLVYGLFERFDGFVFLDSATAEALVHEIAALKQVRTLGELRVLYPTLEQIDGPVDPAEDDWPYQPDATRLDLSAHEDWPPFPAHHGQDLLPNEVVEELDGLGAVDWHAPMLDGEFFIVRQSQETDLVAALARHRISARRDDLIAGLGR